jgi:hypothetical protein
MDISDGERLLDTRFRTAQTMSDCEGWAGREMRWRITRLTRDRRWTRGRGQRESIFQDNWMMDNVEWVADMGSERV